MLETMLIAVNDDDMAHVEGNAAADIIVRDLLPIASFSLDAVENVSGVSAEKLLRDIALEVANKEA
jgi:hypothetical protein